MPSLFRTLFGGGPAPPVEPDLTFARAAEGIRTKTEFAASTWGLGDGGDWAADLEAGTITFTNARGWTISAPVQVVGTLNTTDGTWLWGWDHPSVPVHAAHDAALAREFGAKYGLKSFTERKVEASEEDAWTFTAVACHLAGAQGGYRGPAGTTFVFMTYGVVSIAGNASRGD